MLWTRLRSSAIYRVYVFTRCLGAVDQLALLIALQIAMVAASAAGVGLLCLWTNARAIGWLAALVAGLLLFRSAKHSYRHLRRVGSFRTMVGKRVVLHYDPDLELRRNVLGLVQVIEKEIVRFDSQFGFRFRRPVNAFFFSSHHELSRIYRRPVVGFAIWSAHSIMIANDTALLEVIRHELAHLYSGRWNFHAPSLLSEGLSVWMQETRQGRALDDDVQSWPEMWTIELSALLNRRFFHHPCREAVSYSMAGSFTNFLIREYGWIKYRKLYRWSDGWFFQKKFEYCYGLAFHEAEARWRRDLLAR